MRGIIGHRCRNVPLKHMVVALRPALLVGGEADDKGCSVTLWNAYPGSVALQKIHFSRITASNISRTVRTFHCLFSPFPFPFSPFAFSASVTPVVSRSSRSLDYIFGSCSSPAAMRTLPQQHLMEDRIVQRRGITMVPFPARVHRHMLA